MFRTPFFVALALAIAFSLGIYSAVEAIEAQDPFDTVRVGPWQANPLVQTIDANPYAKARRARSAGFALGQAEGLVFRALTDDDGERLMANCAYIVAGETPQSRLWLLRIAEPDGEPHLNGADFPAVLHSQTVLRRPDGTVSIHLASTPRAGNWLRLAGDAAFLIELTLFDTPAAGNFGLIELSMPSIEKQGCAGDA